MPDFNLRALVHDAMDASDDPGEITSAVVAAIPDDHLHEVVAQTMRPFVISVIGDQRRSARSLPSNVKPLRKPGRSYKASIRDLWPKIRDAKFHGASGWTTFERATYADFVAAADERHRHAESVLNEEKFYLSCAEALKEAGVETLADLPPQTRAKLLAAA